jgi:hypothetical protein
MGVLRARRSPLWGSNPRPYAYEAHALPAELRRHWEEHSTARHRASAGARDVGALARVASGAAWTSANIAGRDECLLRTFLLRA